MNKVPKPRKVPPTVKSINEAAWGDIGVIFALVVILIKYF